MNFDGLDTLPHVFLNSTLPPPPLAGAFGVCYVAFSGSSEARYRGERLLEAAARQLSAAASALGGFVPQCVFTDTPARRRPYVQLVLPLHTSLDRAPFLAKCARYQQLFNRSCKLLFGYMAKAIALARAPYSSTLFLDTDTFVCDAAPLLAFPRLMSRFDVLLLLPRTRQGWVNSGVLAVRRASALEWGMAWQREFESLDDFGDQLHLLKVLPSRRLAVGELSNELHLRYGSVSNPNAQLRLPAVRGPPLLLHSKGLAALSAFTPWVAARLGADPPTPQLRQLAALLRRAPEAKKRGEHNVYSSQALAGFCAVLTEGWPSPPVKGSMLQRQFVLNSEGNCSDCRLPPEKRGSIGAILSRASSEYHCTEHEGSCGVRKAVWPEASDPSLPEWYREFLLKQQPQG